MNLIEGKLFDNYMSCTLYNIHVFGMTSLNFLFCHSVKAMWPKMMRPTQAHCVEHSLTNIRIFEYIRIFSATNIRSYYICFSFIRIFVRIIFVSFLYEYIRIFVRIIFLYKYI